MFSVKRDRVLFLFLLLTTLGIVSQITIGGITRVTGSGDGCPDWPTCFGKWIPPLEYHALIEYSHRSVGTIVGIFTLFICLRIFFKHRNNKALINVSLMLLSIIIIVGLLGGAVVLTELNPAIRTIHLMLAEITVLISVTALIIFLDTDKKPISYKRKWIIFNISKEYEKYFVGMFFSSCLILITILSGSYAVWTNAGFYCPSWPLCGRESIIPVETLEIIHMLHRLLSLFSVIITGYIFYKILRIRNISNIIKIITSLGYGVILTQIIWGALVPLSNFSEWSRAGHLSIATILWTIVVLLTNLMKNPRIFPIKL